MPAMEAVHRIITGAEAGRTQVQIPGRIYFQTYITCPDRPCSSCPA